MPVLGQADSLIAELCVLVPTSHMHRHIETLQRDLPPRSSSSFELTAHADKDSHAETYT